MNCTKQPNNIEDVMEVLLNPLYGVRPMTYQVPELFHGLLIGKLFAKLVRMNDGDYHHALKREIISTLSAFSREEIVNAVRETIKRTDLNIDSPETLTTAIASLPILTIAQQIGIHDLNAKDFFTLVSQFSMAILQPDDRELVGEGNNALMRLYKMIVPARGPLKQEFMKIRELGRKGLGEDEEIVCFNLLGLFFQVLDGTSGLIAQMLQRSFVESKMPYSELCGWSLQHHAPIMHTKRFKDGVVTIVPLQFEASSLPFGAGKHECPGKLWATTMAIEIVDYLRHLPIEKAWLEKSTYKYSPNAKVLMFHS